MAGIFVYSDNVKIVAELTAYARTFKDTVSIVALGEDNAEMMRTAGADIVYLIDGGETIPENYARAIAEFLEGKCADAFFVGATIRGHDLAARVAGYRRCGMIGNAFNIRKTGTGFSADRMLYGGALVQTESFDGFGVLTIGTGTCDPLPPSPPASVEEITLEADKRAKLVARNAIKKSGVDLTSAKVIVSAGLGIEKQEDLGLLHELADKMDGGVGCSRAVCEDRGWFDQYIGISGLNIKPNLYLAVAISGQVQHMFGIRDAKLIGAINKTKDAPIFKSVDYGIIGDYKEVVPLLIEALR